MHANRSSAGAGLLLVISYVLTGKLALLLALPPGYASAIFPPAGLAIGAAYLGGRQYLGWVFLGSLSLNLWIGNDASTTLPSASSLLAAGLIAAASALQAGVGGECLRRFIGPAARFDQSREIFAFLLLAPVICLVSATLSVSGLAALGLFDAKGLPTTWVKWWIGDTLGVTVMLPLLLILFGEPRESWHRRGRTVVLPMLVALSLSILVFIKASRWEQENSQANFREMSLQFANQLQNRLNEHEFLVAAINGFMAHDKSKLVSREEFRHFAGSYALLFPTVQAMEWVPRIELSRRPAFEAAQRKALPSFEILERDPQGQMRRAAGRAEYFPVTYVEPVEPNRTAVGFDLASSPERLVTVMRAMAEGVPIASPPLTLVQEKASQAGVLLMLKVEQPQAGLVLTVLRVGDLMESVLAATPFRPMVRMTDLEAGKLIFGDPPGPPAAIHVVEQRLSYGTRHYRLEIMPSATRPDQHQGWQSLLILAAGLFGTSLLGAILLLGSGHAARVENLVAERTHALSNESKKNQLLLRNSSDGVHILDPAGNVVETSDSFCRMLGYTRDEMLGMNARQWHLAEPGGPAAPETGEAWSDQVSAFRAQYLRKDGSRVDVEVSVYAMDIDGRSLLSLSARDIGERKRAEEQIRQLAYYDTLTGLPNRRLLVDRLRQALTQAKRYERALAIMFLDLDKFKNINDTLGHDAGDELLKEVARRLDGCVRSGDTVSRQGGDEFVIILAEIAHPNDAARVAEKIIKALAEPVRLDQGEIRTSTSIGISVFPVNGDDDVQELMKKADIAMYAAKKAGRNGYRFYAPPAAGDDPGAEA